MTAPSPAVLAARAARPQEHTTPPEKKHEHGVLIHRGDPARPSLFVRPQPGWTFTEGDERQCAVRVAVGRSWIALSRAEALRLADALVDLVEVLEKDDPTEPRR